MSILRTFSSAASRPFFTPPMTGVNGSNYWEKVKTFPTQISCWNFLWVNTDNSVVYGAEDGNHGDVPKWTFTDGEYIPSSELILNASRQVSISRSGDLAVNILLGTPNYLQFLEEILGTWTVVNQVAFEYKLSTGMLLYFSQSGNSVVHFYSKQSPLNVNQFIGWCSIFKNLSGYWTQILNTNVAENGMVPSSAGAVSGNGEYFAAYYFSINKVTVFKWRGVTTSATIDDDWIESLSLTTDKAISGVYLNEYGDVLLVTTYVYSGGGSGYVGYQITYTAYKLNGSTWSQMGTPITVSANDYGTGTPVPRGQILNKNGDVFVVREDASIISRSIKIYKWDGQAWNLVGSPISGIRIGSAIFLDENGSKITISKDQYATPLEQYRYIS